MIWKNEVPIPDVPQTVPLIELLMTKYIKLLVIFLWKCDALAIKALKGEKQSLHNKLTKQRKLQVL